MNRVSRLLGLALVLTTCHAVASPVRSSKDAILQSNVVTPADDSPEMRISRLFRRGCYRILNGDWHSGLSDLRTAARAGHKEAPETLMIYHILFPEETGAGENTAKHWAKVASRRGSRLAVEVLGYLERNDPGRAEDLVFEAAGTMAATTEKERLSLVAQEDAFEVPTKISFGNEQVMKKPRKLQFTVERKQNSSRKGKGHKSTTLSIDLSNESATVFVEGVLTGQPGEVMEIDPGQREIEIVFGDGQTSSAIVIIKEGHAHYIKVRK